MSCFDAMIMVVIDFTAVMQHILIIHTADYSADMALQLPEGLQMFACVIADIIERWVPHTLTLLRTSGLWTGLGRRHRLKRQCV
ncbi:hypothetical protein PO909_003119 [Leuciscus waleckii]